MHQRAFTLIELSIVLVIIGLIAGGVLVGRDLIQIAQARKMMSQMEQFQVAVNTFRLKYNCKPGDCPNASQFGLGGNGNGDGMLGATDYDLKEGAYGGCLFGHHNICLTQSARGGLTTAFYYHRGEPQYFWLHLSSAELIPDTITAMAISDAVVTAEEMPTYFPNDAVGKATLMALAWNSKTYIRTGFTDLRNMKLASFEKPILNATQMQFITSKLGYPPIAGLTYMPDPGASAYPNALLAGHRVIPVGIYTEFALGPFFYEATIAYPVSEYTPCLISDGGSGHVYNLEGGGSCNMLWQIDY